MNSNNLYIVLKELESLSDYTKIILEDSNLSNLLDESLIRWKMEISAAIKSSENFSRKIIEGQLNYYQLIIKNFEEAESLIDGHQNDFASKFKEDLDNIKKSYIDFHQDKTTIVRKLINEPDMVIALEL